MSKKMPKTTRIAETSSDQDSKLSTPTQNPKRRNPPEDQTLKQETPIKKVKLDEWLENDDFEPGTIASRILHQREEDPHTPRKPGRSIGSGLGSAHKAEHEYSDHPRTVSGRTYRQQLSPGSQALEQAKGRDRNAKYHTLKKLRATTEWLEADKDGRETLEADAVEALEESRFRAGQSAEWLENQMIHAENEAKVQQELKETLEAEEDLGIAGKTKAAQLQKREVPEGAHPQIGEVVGRNLGLLVRRWERIAYMAGRRSLELAGDPNPRAHMRHFRQQVTDPENIKNMEVNYAIPPAVDPTTNEDLNAETPSGLELPTPEGVTICLSEDEGSEETLGSEGVDDFIVDDSDEESLGVKEYSDDSSLNLDSEGGEEDKTGEDDTSDEENDEDEDSMMETKDE